MSGVGPTTLESVRAHVDRAKAFIDAGPLKPNGWRPSELIMLGYHMIETGRAGEDRAVEFVNDMLDEARNRYAAGFYANPFAEPVLVREAGE